MIALTVHPGSGTYSGVAVGHVVHAGERSAAIRCFVMVNGVPVSETPRDWGFAVGPVSYVANGGDTVQLCADADTIHGEAPRCRTMGSQDTPPHVVWATTAAIVISYLDPAICAVLARVAGDYAGGVVINSHGDIYVLGAPRYDCPPYDIFWPPEKPPRVVSATVVVELWTT